VGAPRGGFILRSGDAQVVLLSAGIGATPVRAKLHSLSSAASRRRIWWIYGARNRAEHPFAKESRGLLQTLVNSRSYIVYSKPDSGDEPDVDYASVGRVDMPLLGRIGVARDADFYLCGPPSFLRPDYGLEDMGCRFHTNSRGGVWARCADHTGNCAILPPAGSLSRGRRRRWPTDLIYTKWAHGSVGFTVFQFAGTCRSLRRSRTVVVPHRGLPYLRVRIDRRNCPLSA
jgi:hypothetical protein